MTDASFADGADQPLRLLARDSDDLTIISTLVQDAIAERREMQFNKARHEFSLLLKRFRWEDADTANRHAREYERVQSVLMIRNATAVQFSGFDGADHTLAFDLIALHQQDDKLHMIFAGDGEISITIEAIDLVLADVSRPYRAKSPNLPQHPDEDDVPA